MCVLTSWSVHRLQSTGPRSSHQGTVSDVYLIDRRGAHYILPVQAKGAGEWIGAVQIEQDLAVCAGKFPGLICRPIAAQFMADDLIALFELEQTEQGVRVSSERH